MTLLAASASDEDDDEFEDPLNDLSVASSRERVAQFVCAIGNQVEILNHTLLQNLEREF
jgi:hypothetical protein